MSTKNRKLKKSQTHGTMAYFKLNRWSGIKSRTNPSDKKYGISAYAKRGIKLKMTKDEFYMFCDLNEKKIMQMWQKKALGDAPSINRIDSMKHYSLDNIEIITQRQNCSSQIKQTRPIIGINIKTSEVIRFRGCTTNEVKQLKWDPSTIHKICSKKNNAKTYKGYRWFFYDDPEVKNFL